MVVMTSEASEGVGSTPCDHHEVYEMMVLTAGPPLTMKVQSLI